MMKNFSKNKLIQLKAIELLPGNFSSLISILVFSSFLAFCIENIALLLYPPSNTISLILSYIITFIFSSISGILTFGIAYIYLKLSCQQLFSLSDLFYGFKQDLLSCFFLSTLFTTLNLVASSILLLYQPTSTINDFSLYLIESMIYLGLVLLSLLLYFLLSLIFSQVFYLKLDYPHLNNLALLKKSIKLMKGNWWQYLTLHVSFLPLLLLCVSSFGIAYLWISPYIQTANALFYLDIIKDTQKD